MTRTNDVSKTAVVIGATSGIGREVAAQLASQGYRVGITGRREALLEELARSAPQRYETAAFDIAQPDACDRLAALTGSLGSPELIVFCSGDGRPERRIGLPDRGGDQPGECGRIYPHGRLVLPLFRMSRRGMSRGGYLGDGTARQPHGPVLCRVESLSDQLPGESAPEGLPSKASDSGRRYPSRIGAHGDDERRGHFWIASPQRAAQCICRAVRKGRSVQYVTPRWRWIGLALKIIPRSLYRRM